MKTREQRLLWAGLLAVCFTGAPVPVCLAQDAAPLPDAWVQHAVSAPDPDPGDETIDLPEPAADPSADEGREKKEGGDDDKKSGASKMPNVELSSEGINSFENGVASAEGNVQLLYGDISMYSDKVAFDTASGWARAEGNVRIYTADGFMWTGEKVNYNVKTKELDAEATKFISFPIAGSAENVRTLTSPSGNTIYEADFAVFTTENRENPGFRLQPRSLTYDPVDNRYVMRSATLYAGPVPIFWVPKVVYDPGGFDISLQATPGYRSGWGAFLLTGYGFRAADNLHVKLRTDLRSERGAAFGTDMKWTYGERTLSSNNYEKPDEGKHGQGILSLYFANDLNPEGATTSDDESLAGIFGSGAASPEDRYRLKLQQQAFFTPERDIYATVSLDKLSDKTFERDFFERAFRLERQPDNYAEVVKYDPNFTLTVLARQQVNDFFETVEREPEILFEAKRQRVFAKFPLEYSGQSSLVQLDRKYSNEDADLPRDYNALRADTFHQLALPHQFFGWLNVGPRVGWRGTFYDDSMGEDDPLLTVRNSYGGTGESGHFHGSGDGGDIFRSTLNVGFDTSFKLSRMYEHYNSDWGIHQVRHTMEPFMNFSYIPNPSVSPDRIMQFDGRLPSTRLQPLEFPQYNSIDSIDNQTLFRLGLRQLWQTKRERKAWSFLELATYTDVDIERQYYNDHPTSNLYNELTFRPVSWMAFELYNAMDLYDDGFNELNTRVRYQVIKPLELSLGTRYINGAEGIYPDSNQFVTGLMYRVNDNWALGTRHVYEAETSRLEFQEYSLYRDLSSWRMAATAQVRDQPGDQDEYLFYLSFTLKSLPGVELPAIGLQPDELEPITLGAGPR